VNAVVALGLDFGAVDLLIGDDGQTYVLEVNTAPACSPMTAACYIGAFQRLLGLPEEQIDLTRLDILSPDQDDGDTEDEVEGEDDTETEV
jgi:D-alanine-D-alanine ligase-like ATP-grasp enzyme